MPALTWTALGVFLLVTVAGMTQTAVLGFRIWRRLRALLHEGLGALDGILASLDELETRAALAERGNGRLQGRIARLRRSVARLRVLAGAARDVYATVAFARAFVRK